MTQIINSTSVLVLAVQFPSWTDARWPSDRVDAHYCVFGAWVALALVNLLVAMVPFKPVVTVAPRLSDYIEYKKCY